MIEGRFAEAGLAPPPVSELINERTQKARVIEGVIGFLVKQGTLVRLAEGIYVHRDALAAARERMSTAQATPSTSASFKEFFASPARSPSHSSNGWTAKASRNGIGDSRRCCRVRTT